MADEPVGGGMWCRQAAGSVDGLSELGALVHAEEARRLIAVYAALMAQSGGAPPAKADFDPMELRGAISHAVLYDVSDPKHVIFRIVGERMESHFKVNPVGRCYLEFVPEARREHALAAFRRCAETPCGMLSRTRQVFDSGLTRFCEAVGVPLMGGDAQAPATHLLFVDTPVAAADQDRLDDSPFRFANLLERRFVDLGCGLPDAFEDLVPTGVRNPFDAAGTG